MKDLIIEYYTKHHSKFENELSFFRYHITLEKAVKHAILSVDNEGKKFSHQKRVKEVALKATYNNVKKCIQKIAKTKKFDEIYSIINENKHKGFNGLCVYDSSLRIAEYKRIQLTHIYLQAGSLEGAKKLQINSKVKIIDKKQVPKKLQVMEEKHLENFLCVMKDCF